jgi:hypothetical protein
VDAAISARSVRLAALASFLVLAACGVGKGQPAGSDETVRLVCSQTSASCNSIQGYSGNAVTDGATGATIAGGGQRGAPNRVTAQYGTIGGGEANMAGEGSTVGGGYANTAINFHAMVGGGANNVASAHEATVAGGFKNTASERFATVGGGALNMASNINATVAGGSGNTASFTFAAVGGGTQNLASNTASVVSGGDHNLAEGAYSGVLGGLNNTASGNMSTVGGGAGNSVSGLYAVVAGGFANAIESDYSFAAGRKAHVMADHPGTFLFADSKDFPFPSLTANEFAVRATGGIRLVTAIDANGQPLSGARLTAGSGSWETLSDANSNSGFAQADEHQILERLMTMPIRTWSYKGQEQSVRHIGPTAQDFHAAFGLGQDDHYISTVDADGIALAAIQELYRMQAASGNPDMEARLQSLESRLFMSNFIAALACAIALGSLWRRSTAVRTAPTGSEGAGAKAGPHLQ